MEEELSTLQKKFASLENEFDNVNEQLQTAQTKLEAADKRTTEVRLHLHRSRFIT